MLILTRHEGDEIIIAGNIRIRHCGKSQQGGTKIGIEAPPDIEIIRAEIAGGNRDRRRKLERKP